MLNQLVIVGRLVSNIELKENEEGKYAEITLAVPRSYKNAEGDYDTDFIKVLILNSIAENSVEYLKQGDLIGIKGRIESIKMESDYSIQIIAEKLTFLSNKKEEV